MKKYLLITLWLLAALACPAEDGKELLKNPNFEDGLEPWLFIYSRTEYKGKVRDPRISKSSKDENPLPVCTMIVPHASSRHYIRLDQDMDNLVEGKSYKLTIEARYKGVAGAFWSGVQMKDFPHKNYGLHAKYALTPQWQRFESRFTMKPIDSEHPPCFRLYYGDLKGVVDLRGCSMVEIEEGPFTRTNTTVIQLEEAPVEVVKKYQALDVDLVDMVAAFAKSALSAQQTYGKQILQLTDARITGAGKSMKPGTFALELNYGKVRAIVGGKEFDAEAFEELEDNIRAVRKSLKEAEKEAKKKKDYIKKSSAEQKEEELSFYPTLSCEGKFASFRNKVIELGPTRFIEVTLANP